MEIRRDDILRVRVEKSVRQEVRLILSNLGLTESVAVNLFYNMIRIKRGLPFEVVVPKPANGLPLMDKEDTKCFEEWFGDKVG